MERSLAKQNRMDRVLVTDKKVRCLSVGDTACGLELEDSGQVRLILSLGSSSWCL